MTTTHPDFKPGDWVIYYPGYGEREDGEVIRVTDGLVMVLYSGDRTPKATRPEDLEHGRAWAAAPADRDLPSLAQGGAA